MAKNKPLSQGDFLRDAMKRLGMKTIDEFAERLGTPKRTLENWLASPDSSSYRTMPEIAWKFVREILQNV
ncbi:transcriptional regulator [Burkholderia anthina]|uniref:transcriptional regulator n=1 Tax=Burkholderia anthina TaxID=179879 RepID=UPI0037BEF3E4